MKRYMLIVESSGEHAFFYDTYEEAAHDEDIYADNGYYVELYERVECGIGLEYKLTRM